MVKPEKAWACVAIQGKPEAFIHVGTVRDLREDTQKRMGKAWVRPGETWRQGWRRAYRAGWRAVRVTVEIFPERNEENGDG